MRQATYTLTIKTSSRGLVEITRDIARWLSQGKMMTGLLTVFCRHTSASLLIQENADPDVLKELEAFFARIAPEEPGRYTHDAEGPDDMPSHIRAALTQTQLSIPVISGKIALGTWQGVHLFEHRRAPHQRQIVLHFIGD
jgi:secondary thiamine-phosphate synthase enzyme